MKDNKYNVVIIGVSYFEGMASSTRVRNLFEPLINKNCITASNIIYQKNSGSLSVKKGILKNVRYRVIGFRKSNPFSAASFILNGAGFLRKQKLRQKKNILYSYDQPDLKNIFFLLYAKLIGYKIVLDIVEDNRYYTIFPRLLTKIKTRSSVFFFNHCRFFANAVINISAHLYDQTKKITRQKVPAYLIPVTVNMKKFEKITYGQLESFKIFYGGSFGKKDGLEYLIKAFENVYEEFKNVTLILTGKGSKDDMNFVLQLIENSTAKEKISFKGYLSSDEYYKLLNECDIFCVTRINSDFAKAGFPFKLGEFLATGKCVIATNLDEISKYLINNFNALLINPSSVEELTNALSYLLNNPEKIKLIGTEGRKTAEEYFDSEKVSQQLFEIFETL